ncbi:hypothetical protein B0T17DRAFT_497928 [Bombardia bombarda]|uniref:SWR1-complex protein 4 n=1 Tax=Bombardia bombarda TaxID=252184 RepID=A0AA40BV96_9PEZI|nr:hypothetical protein B0T17DRAFT_497928 [Bombardia bombarda]
MASHDLRDVLNLPSDHSAGPRPSKKQKTGTPRPNLKGLAREVQNLGGDNPIAIVPEVSIFKKRRIASRKPVTKWELKAFTNSARADDGALVLRHWKRKSEAETPSESVEDRGSQQPDGMAVDGERDTDKVDDSAFAKFNVRVAVPQYNEDQYHRNLQHNDWTKEETDYLLGLAEDYDLRWAIIWDRYDFTPKTAEIETDSNVSTAVFKPRSMEDLKARYYEVAAKMMAVQKAAQYMTGPEFELYETMQNFNPDQELRRKKFALETMSRSKDEAREEESLLLEIKRIMARTERFNEERRELYNRLDYPSTDSDINSFKSSAGLQTLLQNLMNVDKSKKRKSIIVPGAEAATPTTAVPGSAVSETAPPNNTNNSTSNRRESIAASVPGGGHRDSTAGTPATPVEPAAPNAANKKKGAAPPERRKLTEQEETIYGLMHHERLGSGPTFRYEKINKLYSHKSGQQQLRITNALAELDVPPRLAMPTAAVTAQFELLWAAVTSLVDLRKVCDKLDGEIKIEEAKKAERDKARGISGGDVKDKEQSGGKTKPGATSTSGEGRPGTKRPASSGGGDKLAAPRPSSSGTHKRSASVLSSTSDKSSKRQKK